MNKIKKMTRLVIALVIVAIAFAGCKSIQNPFDKPSVPADYQNESSITLPLEKKYTQNGAHSVKSQVFESGNSKYKTYKIWYPSELENTSKSYPLVIMANGTGVTYQKYEAIFEHLASWGFVVAGNDDNSSMFGESTDNTLTFLLEQNKNSKSVFYNKIDTDKIGVGGHSQGGVGAVSAVVYFSNGKMYKSVFGASGGHDEAYKMTIPYFLVAGTGNVDTKLLAKPEKFLEQFNKKEKGVTILARRKNADHGQMLYIADGYMTAWFLYTLTGDNQAKQVFVGNNAELTKNPNWQDVKIKNAN